MAPHHDDLSSDDEVEQSRRRDERRAARERRRRARRRRVAAIAAVSAVAGAFAAGAPTGLTVADGLYRAGFAGAVAAAGSRGRRWTWFVAAGAAGAVGSDEVLPFVLAGLGLAVAFASLVHDRYRREYGAVAGLFAAQALLRLPTDLPFGVPTLTAVLAPLPLVVSALINVRRRRPYAVAAGVAAGVLVVIGAAFAYGMFDVEDRARQGLRATRDGLAAAGEGDDAAALASFATAERELGDARDTATAWWLGPARAVPVLAPHVEAVDRAVEEGAALAALASDQAETLDVTGLTRDDGTFDLDRIGDLQPRAATVAGALERAGGVLADIDSPWLLPPAAERIDELADEVARVTPTARTAADALELAPGLLGADGPQRYVVLVGNPAEARQLGGFVAAAGVLTADEGALGFEAGEGIAAANDLVREAGVELDPEALPGPVPPGQPEEFVQNWSNTADIRVAAGIADQLGPAFVGGDVAGVLYLDPYVVAALLEISGPVAIEGRAERLGADDAVDFLLREQYLSGDFDRAAGDRKERIRDAAEAAFDRLTSSQLPDPRRLANRLGPLVQARRLLFSATDERTHDLLGRVGLRPALDVGRPDQLLLTQQNLRANKLDAYLSRAITYDLEIDDAGAARGTVTVDLTNTAPVGGLNDYVTGDGSLVRPEPLPESLNRLSLVLYSRLEVVDVTVEGEPARRNTTTVGELWRNGVRVDVPPASTVRVVYEVRGALDAGRYGLAVLPNATADTDTFAGEIRLPERTLSIDRRPVDAEIGSG